MIVKIETRKLLELLKNELIFLYFGRKGVVSLGILA
jgi:hypothetical protein